jgi:hypothetical protein
MRAFDWEPHLSQVLDDPIIRAVMRCDGVEADELQALMAAVRRRLDERAHAMPGERRAPH